MDGDKRKGGTAGLTWREILRAAFRVQGAVRGIRGAMTRQKLGGRTTNFSVSIHDALRAICAKCCDTETYLAKVKLSEAHVVWRSRSTKSLPKGLQEFHHKAAYFSVAYNGLGVERRSYEFDDDEVTEISAESKFHPCIVVFKIT